MQLLLANILCHVATSKDELEKVVDEQGMEIKELTFNCAFSGFSDKFDFNKHRSHLAIQMQIDQLHVCLSSCTRVGRYCELARHCEECFLQQSNPFFSHEIASL